MNSFIKISMCVLNIVIIHACASTATYVDNVIKLENHLNQSHKASDIFSSCEIIVLENPSKNSILSSIDRIAIMENRVFVLDEKGNHVVAFDGKGKFIASTSKLIGKGKNEYIRVQDMTIDQQMNRVYLYCDAPYRFLVMDFDLNVEKCFEVDYLAKEICVESNNLYALCHNLEKENIYELRSYDKLKPQGPYKTIITYDKSIPGVFANGKSISSNGTSCFCSMPFDNHIYEVHGNEVINSYIIDFSDQWFDPSLSKGMKGGSFIQQNIEKNWMIQNISSSDSILIFNTNKSRSFYLNLFEKSGAMYRSQLNDMFPFSCSKYTSCQSLEGSTTVFAIPAEYLHGILEYYKEDGKDIPAACINLIDNLTKDKSKVNPLIVKMKIK